MNYCVYAWATELPYSRWQASVSEYDPDRKIKPPEFETLDEAIAYSCRYPDGFYGIFRGNEDPNDEGVRPLLIGYDRQMYEPSGK
jgi:hypothetical protein